MEKQQLKHIEVILSSYNGENCIIKQLESIFNQEDVYVTCTIRDDGSTDNTVQYIENYRKNHNYQIQIIKGVNIGWKKSFLEALKQSQKADFYAFSDQDDIWFPNKLKRSIDFLQESDISVTPTMYHSNRLSVYSNLEPLKKQMPKISSPINFENSLIQEFAQGCTIVMNQSLKDLVCKHTPQDIPHDFWTGLLAYCFGKIIYDNAPTLYHIHHNKNQSSDGKLFESWLSRLKSISTHKMYENPSYDLLSNYRSLLTHERILFLTKLYNNRTLKNKLSLIFNRNFRRCSTCGTIMLKIAVLINKI